jgi:phosphoglycerol transferase MdoB-like AlkP superfamily enzyme
MDPSADLAAIGLFPSLWLYWQAERAPLPMPPERPWLEQIPALAPRLDHAKLPDLVVVQSESFFDARRLYPGVRSDLFSHFDALSAQALAHGQLKVPAWGANTMRTEFAVLTGIPDATLGVHRFNPYHRFAESGPLALPQQLRRLGYHTVCIHPHPAGFFGRDQVFPRIGFDAFIDIAAFAEALRIGPYVADAAVTAKISEVLGSARVPTFIFAITMENHGPLHLEQFNPRDIARLYQTPPPPGWEDLTVYLRHLANANQMLRDLAGLLNSRPRPGLLCWFGDHVPSLPKVYGDLAFTDASTDYLIWSGARDGPPAVDIDAHQLPEVLLTALVKTAGTTDTATGHA